MRGIAKRAVDLVGNTPMLELSGLMAQGYKGLPLHGRVLGKLECENPMKSVKDRIGRSIVDDFERRNLIVPGKTVLVEATSGIPPDSGSPRPPPPWATSGKVGIGGGAGRRRGDRSGQGRPRA